MPLGPRSHTVLQGHLPFPPTGVGAAAADRPEHLDGPRPLVKWAGGKRQLLRHLLRHLPDFTGRYFEPFAGGAALLVELYRRGHVRHAVVSDVNPHLYNLYTVVKIAPEELIRELADLRFANTPEDFYRARDVFNACRVYTPPDARMAALMLYLNRHCFNGLWRENTSGCMNAPFGRYRRPKMPLPGEIWSFHRLLQRVEVLRSDFEEAVSRAGPGDFVYFDPPYMPISATASFVDYTSGGFSLEDQQRLARVARELARRGVFVMVSNADRPEIREIYQGFHVHAVTALRCINAKGDRRTGTRELIITSYPS